MTHVDINFAFDYFEKCLTFIKMPLFLMSVLVGSLVLLDVA